MQHFTSRYIRSDWSPTEARRDACVTTDAATDKRAAKVEQLLASTEFGVNWANYWSDVISYRTPQPELNLLKLYTFQKFGLHRNLTAEKSGMKRVIKSSLLEAK